MQPQTVEPGALLAGRYRVEELLDEVVGAQAWRAVDEILRRPVLVHTMPADDPRAAPVTRAARAAAAARDPRFLRVLDATVTGDIAYVIREYVPGRNLTGLLAEGALPVEAAGALARELAEAVASAHAEGLAHLELMPDTVIIAPDGTVKIAGLATDAAFHGTTADDPAREDTRGVARILYAGLTGRWPQGAGYGLPGAPLVDGRLAAPRQVRAGVPRALDDVVVRSLDDHPRHGQPLTTPAELAGALAAAVPPPGRRGVPHPVLIRRPVEPVTEPIAALPRVLPPPARGRGTRRRGARGIWVLAGLLLAAGVTLLGWQLVNAFPGGMGADPPQTTSPSPSQSDASGQPTAGTPIEIVEATDYDPLADPPRENPGLASLAVDGDPATAWTTSTYYVEFDDYKDGVGLAVDLGSPQAVAEVGVVLVGSGSDVEVRVVPGATALPAEIDGWEVAGSADDAGERVDVPLTSPVSTRYVLIWLTGLPGPVGEQQGGVAEVEVST